MKKKTKSTPKSEQPAKDNHSKDLVRQAEGYISRVNQDGTVILMHLSDVSNFFKLTKLVAAIWPELRQVRSADGLVAHFSKLMPKQASQIAKDIPKALELLEKNGLLEEGDEKESKNFDTTSLSMEKYEVGTVQIFDLDKIETEVLNESIYLDVFAGSDLRLKTDVKRVEGALEKIQALEGVHYKWSKKARKAGGKKAGKGMRTGLIAQQVLEQMPELVRADEKTGVLAVNYTKMNAYLVEAVKELSARVEELERRLEKSGK